MLTRRILGRAALASAAAAVTVAQAGPAAAQAAGESTWEKVRRTRKLQIAAVAGGEPYYHRDLATKEWSGFCVDMAKDLATALEAEIQILESTWGNAILDLQSGKIDVMFGVNPTPARALVIDFSKPFLNNSFTVVARPDFAPASWTQLNDPKVRLAVDAGSSHDAIARHLAPKATITGYRTADEATLAVQSGRADAQVLVVILALTALKKNPSLGKLVIPTPVAATISTVGVRQEPDKRLRDFISVWADYNRGLGQVREWVVSNFERIGGIKPDDLPADLQF